MANIRRKHAKRATVGSYGRRQIRTIGRNSFPQCAYEFASRDASRMLTGRDAAVTVFIFILSFFFFGTNFNLRMFKKKKKKKIRPCKLLLAGRCFLPKPPNWAGQKSQKPRKAPDTACRSLRTGEWDTQLSCQAACWRLAAGWSPLPSLALRKSPPVLQPMPLSPKKTSHSAETDLCSACSACTSRFFFFVSFTWRYRCI